MIPAAPPNGRPAAVATDRSEGGIVVVGVEVLKPKASARSLVPPDW